MNILPYVSEIVRKGLSFPIVPYTVLKLKLETTNQIMNILKTLFDQKIFDTLNN